MNKPRFYLDENIHLSVAEQLRLIGIDAIHVAEMELRGEEDLNHLQQAIKLGYVLCTHDTDFLNLAKIILEHNGIIFAEHYKATPGGWVRALREMHEKETPETLFGLVRYVSVK